MALGLRFLPAGEGAGGLTVDSVFPGTAATPGIRPVDVRVAFDGKPAAESAAVLGLLRAGERIWTIMA